MFRDKNMTVFIRHLFNILSLYTVVLCICRWCPLSYWTWSQRKQCLSTWSANQKSPARRGSKSRHVLLQDTHLTACVTHRYTNISLSGQNQCDNNIVSRWIWKKGLLKVGHHVNQDVDLFIVWAKHFLSSCSLCVSGGDPSGWAACGGSGQSSLRFLSLWSGPLLLWALRGRDQREAAHLSSSTFYRLPAALQRLHFG